MTPLLLLLASVQDPVVANIPGSVQEPTRKAQPALLFHQDHLAPDFLSSFLPNVFVYQYDKERQSSMPDNWNKFILTSMCPDVNGHIRTQRDAQDDICPKLPQNVPEMITVPAVLSDKWKKALGLAIAGLNSGQPIPAGRTQAFNQG